MQCFSITTKEYKDRLDPFYYQPFFADLKDMGKRTPFGIKTVEQITKFVVDGIHKTPNYTKDGLPFIQVNNIKEANIDFSSEEVKSVDEDWKSVVLKRYNPEPGDVLITKDGTIGIAASVPNNYPSFSIFVSVAAVRPKKNLVLPKFLEIAINSPVVQKQIYRLSRGAALKHLLLEEIRKLQIPLPPMNVQGEIVSLMEDAYNEKERKEQRAKALLNSIDDFVLNELGIEIPELEYKQYYSVPYRRIVEADRIDPFYYQPKFKRLEQAIESGKYKTSKIGNALDVLSEGENIEEYESIKYIDLASIDRKLGTIGNFRELTPENAPNRARRRVTRGDLLLASLRGSLKSIAVVEDTSSDLIASTGFVVLKNSSEWNSYFLWALFRSWCYQVILERLTTGAIMSAFNKTDFEKITIPMPPLKVQNKIGEGAKLRQKKVEKLQKEAQEVVKKAKQKVEQMILN